MIRLWPVRLRIWSIKPQFTGCRNNIMIRQESLSDIGCIVFSETGAERIFEKKSYFEETIQMIVSHIHKENGKTDNTKSAGLTKDGKSTGGTHILFSKWCNKRLLQTRSYSLIWR